MGILQAYIQGVGRGGRKEGRGRKEKAARESKCKEAMVK